MKDKFGYCDDVFGLDVDIVKRLVYCKVSRIFFLCDFE